MSHVSVEQINDASNYEQLVEIKMSDLVGFVGKYYKQFTPVIALHYFMSLLTLAAWLWTGWQNGVLDTLLASLGWGVLAFLVILPFHEWLHGITYQYFGAKDVRYRFIPRKLIAYAVAHHFVADRREFMWAAWMPSLVINSLLVAAAVFFPEIRLISLASLLLHIGGTTGDFALLNFLWVHRDRDLYTYDDADAQISYFHAARTRNP